MTWRGRRRGFFEGPPRALYGRTGPRYFDAAAVAAVINGVVVSGFLLVTVVLYVDVSLGELAIFAACSAAGYAVEGLVAGAQVRRAAQPVVSWLAGERGDASTSRAWSAAARLPLELLRHPSLYGIGAAGAAAADLVLAALLDLPAYQAVLLFPASYLLYLYSAELRYIALDIWMRPVLETIGERLPAASPPAAARVSLHSRLLATVPMVSWGTAVVVAGLVTTNARDLDKIGLASVVAIAVTGVISIWLSLVLADTVSAPIVDLRDATRSVGAGDLDVRVPVVSTDETGELAASFNAMVAGLGERERLREAFGAFVDPALTERVVTEGTDIRG
jgi:adenylate cyclase